MGSDLINRWALVTGASSGIGEHLARGLAARGCHLVLVARREERLTALAEELTADSEVEVQVRAMDLSKPGAAEALTAAVADLPISILVNNAGFAMTGPFMDHERDRLGVMIDLNIRFLTDFTLIMLPRLLAYAGRAHLLNVGSIAGYQGVPYMGAYSATKAYVNNLSEGLAWELRDTNVAVTCLQPGKTATEFFAVADIRSQRFIKSNTMNAAAVARQGLRAMTRGKSKVVTGWLNKFSVFSLRFSPRWMVRIVIGRIFKDLKPS